MKKPRKLKPPTRVVTVGRIFHVSYTSDYLDYIGHKLEREEKGQPVE